MAHFAEVDENNLVTRVLVVPNAMEYRGQEYMADDLGLGGTWIQTSYNANFRYNYAGEGFLWDPEFGDGGAFIAPKPFESWTLDENAKWQPPVAYPEGEGFYTWNEETTSWDEVTE